MNAAIYARVSTRETEKKQDTEVQIAPLVEYCLKRSWGYEIYVDDVSAVKVRPKFNQMMKDAQARKFDVILVVKLDRIARSLSNFVSIIHQLNSAGIRFISITQGIDTDTQNPANRLTMNVLAAMAEFERDLISERVKAGIKRNKEKGHKFGRKPILYDREKLRAMMGTESTLPQIAEALGMSVPTAFRVVRKEREVIRNVKT